MGRNRLIEISGLDKGGPAAGRSRFAVIPEPHLCPFRRGQRVTEFADRAAQNRVPPVGGHIRHRHQHEGPVLQARMGQDQLIGAAAALLFGGQREPVLKTCLVRQNGVLHGDQVEIQRPCAPAGQPLPACGFLDGMECRKRLPGSAAPQRRKGRICIIRPRTGGKSRGTVYRTGDQPFKT